MFKKILVPLDGSEHAEMALPYAEDLMRRLSAELVLFHACGPAHRSFERMHRIYIDDVLGKVEARMNAGGGQAAGRVSVRIEDCPPTEDVCALIGRNQVDLVVMTAVGSSGISIGKSVGSVADSACRTLPIPVLLIRAKSPERPETSRELIRSILVPLDGSDLSKLALPAAESLASGLNAPITLFQMVRAAYLYGGDPVPFLDYEKLTQDEVKNVRDQMAAVEADLGSKGIGAISRVVSGADAAEEIISVAESSGIDLIVMSTHGRSGLSHLVLGSVAEKVMAKGNSPLLLVHARAG